MRRRFLGWDRPILHSAADLLIESAETSPSGGGPFGAPRPGAPRRIDLSHLLVVLPGGRAERRLLELLLDRSEAAGLVLIPPRTTTPGRLPEALYRPSRPAPSSIVESLAWAAAIAEVERSIGGLGLLLPGTEEGKGDREWHALASTLQTLHREVESAGVDFAEVARRCGEGFLFNDEERWQVLAAIEDRYLKILERHGVLDRAEARRRALGTGGVRAEGDIWVVGAPDLAPLTRAFLREAAAAVRVEVCIGAPESLDRRFDDLGCVIPEEWQAVRAELPDDSIRILPNPAAQAEAVVEELLGIAGNRPAEEITIGVPNPGLIPYLEERLEEAGIPVRYGGGTAIERTPPFLLLEQIARYLRRRDFQSFASLIRHPDLEGYQRTLPIPPFTLPSIADRYQTAHFQSRIDAGRLPSGGEGSASIEPIFRKGRDLLLGLLHPLDEVLPLSEWGGGLRNLILAVYGESSLRKEIERERVLMEFADRAGRILEAFGSIPSGLDRGITGERALRYLIDELRGEAIPPTGEEGAVELLGWLELPLDDAEVVFVTGVNEPHLPDSVLADPFLPHTLRQRLGLLDNQGRWARDLLHLRSMIAIHPELRLFAGRRDAEGNPLLPSRLLLAEEPDTTARRILTFLGDGAGAAENNGASGGEGADDGRSGEGRRAGEEIGRRSAFALPPEPELERFPLEKGIRVTDFSRILADPYRFALERSLNLRSEEDRLRELDPLGFGSLSHTIFERFGRGEAAASEDPALIRDALEEILDSEARRRFGDRSLPAVRIQLEQLRLRLFSFAVKQAEWRREGWMIRGVEVAASEDAAILVVDEVPVRLSGKVDRIDLHETTGVWRLLDYKTGEEARTPEEVHRKGRKGAREWMDLQLPLYRHLASALQDTEGNRIIPAGATVEVGYLLVPRDPAKIAVAAAPWSDEEVEGALETAREVIRFLRRGRFHFDPTRSSIRRGDPLAPVVGGGVLLLDEPDVELEEEGGE